MIIPEILPYLEEADLEDWLTAAFIENVIEPQTGELLFTLDTETAEVTFQTKAPAYFRHQDSDASALLS
jgi:hypothetical protein